jgi:hypothetical protein
MSVDCLILTQTVRDQVAGGEEKGYLNDSALDPIRRAGGGTNPDPCYILNVSILTNPDFATAQPYLSGCPIKTYPDDPTFPGVYTP